jgi:hypothetical protein
MYIILLITLMIIFTVCISLIISNRKNKLNDNFTDSVEVIDNDYSIDREII